MTRSHTHRCSNASLGCSEFYLCYALPEEDDCGKHCPYENEQEECEECLGASRCEDCGAFLSHLLEPHDDRCELGVLNRDDSPFAKSLVEGLDVEGAA